MSTKNKYHEFSQHRSLMRMLNIHHPHNHQQRTTRRQKNLPLRTIKRKTCKGPSMIQAKRKILTNMKIMSKYRTLMTMKAK